MIVDELRHARRPQALLNGSLLLHLLLHQPRVRSAVFPLHGVDGTNHCLLLIMLFLFIEEGHEKSEELFRGRSGLRVHATSGEDAYLIDHEWLIASSEE